MGILIAFATAFTVAFQNTKLRQLKEVNTHFLNWLRFTIGAFILAALVTIFADWNIPSQPFWILILGVSLPAEIVVSYTYVKAFQLSPQSLVGPLFSLSLVFLIPLSYFILSELPTFFGFIGVGLLLAGSYYLGSDETKSSLIKNIKNIIKEKGSYFMLIAALFGAIAVSVAKFSFQYTSPLQFAFYITVLLSIVYTPIALKNVNRLTTKQWKASIIMSIAYGVGTAFHYIGLSLLLAAYFIAIKRMSILFDVILGKMVLKEKHFRQRLLGATFMAIGVILILLG